MDPKISVVMPTFNYGKFIGLAIESILNQTFSDFELIIIDDFSSDDSIEVIGKYREDKRLTLIKSDFNMGNYKARNRGIQASRGAYVAAMDADDVADSNRLAIQYDYLKKTQIAGVGSQAYLIDENGNVGLPLNFPTDEDVLKVSLLQYNYTLHPSIMFNKRILKQSHSCKYSEKFYVASDYDFVSRCAYFHRFVNLPDRLMFYRRHISQISQLKRDDQMLASREIRQAQLARLGLRTGSAEISNFHRLVEGAKLRPNECQQAIAVMNRIIEINETKKVYSENVLFAFFKYIAAAGIRGMVE